MGTRSRPDIATSVSMLAKFQSNFARAHWRAMKHVFRYIKGTVLYEIMLPCMKTVKAELCGWCAVDWTRDQDAWPSRSKYVLSFTGGTILWGLKLQRAVAPSTAEAEFDALTQAVREVFWTTRILAGLGISGMNPTTMYGDILPSMTWTDEVHGFRNVKHICQKYHYDREVVQSGEVGAIYTPSAENRADGLTNALVGDTFFRQR